MIHQISIDLLQLNTCTNLSYMTKKALKLECNEFYFVVFTSVAQDILNHTQMNRCYGYTQIVLN